MSVLTQATTTCIYATIKQAQTNSGEFVNLPGLSFELPPHNAEFSAALVTLCVPNSYSNGNNNPGTSFNLDLNGISVASGSYTSGMQTDNGRKPFTLVVKVQLQAQTTFLQAQWATVRGGPSIIDSFCSLSALLCK
ncbi:MAG TPA: hypothetical protein VKZ53_28640 [Candidatus Angelobacter sp.]|nr:hypothetical protein [Candidatus Angelobacter sp.]